MNKELKVKSSTEVSDVCGTCSGCASNTYLFDERKGKYLCFLCEPKPKKKKKKDKEPETFENDWDFRWE